jgi:hypothetical protein
MRQASETVSNVLFDCEALNTFRFRHLGQHFMKPGALEEVYVSRMLHCLKCKAATSTNKRYAKKKVEYCQSAQVTTMPALLVFFSIQTFAKSTQTANKGVTEQ